MAFLKDLLLVLKELIKNGILLFGLGFLYAINDYGILKVNRIRKIRMGVIIGVIAILIMMFPWTFQEGIFFDTRTVLYSISGVFFGGLTTIVAASIGILYRALIGGVGVYSGIITIIVSTILGLMWVKIRALLPKMKISYEYYSLGLFTSILTLLCFIIVLPAPLSYAVIKSTVIPYLVVFPFISVILGRIIEIQKERVLNERKIKNQQSLLQASIDATSSTEIYAVDTNYCYLTFNQCHAQAMRHHYDVNIRRGQNYLDLINNNRMKMRLTAYINRALLGENHTTVIEVEDNNNKFIEESYSPICNDEGKIIGVTVMSQDVSERKKYEQVMINLSYYDSLTNIPNRRYYDEKFQLYNKMQNYPLSIISIDINGLKIFNDAFGHDIGDELLCNVAQDLLAVFSGKGIVARIGGDEFSVLLPNVPNVAAQVMLEEAKRNIENHCLNGINISISAGIATKDSQSNDIDLNKTSDEAMYINKFTDTSLNRRRIVHEILEVLHQRNPYEKTHTQVSKEIAVQLAKAFDFNAEDVELIRLICDFHDIGKIAIPDEILKKPSTLTDKEWNIIRKHPERGYRILIASLEYMNIAEDVFSHHERYDGTGYPRRLKGKQIPVKARIVAVADAYGSMVTECEYRQQKSSQEALNEILKNTGSQFDPEIVKALERILQ